MQFQITKMSLFFEERNFVHSSGHVESIRNAPRGSMYV